MIEIPWYKKAVFYEAPLRAFYDSNADGIGDLAGFAQKLDYLVELGVDCIWLNPIYPSPLKDDGYDISDFYAIHPDYGSLDDFTQLVQQAHQRGLRLIADLVINHTSDQHPWFQSARKSPGSPYRDYYVWSDTERRYTGARIIFVDSEKSNWAWDAAAGQYYWHRFYSHQPDLNYDNPKVRAEMLSVMGFWLGRGIDGFRVDAVPYLFEREGTSCENLPETHAFLKEMRQFLEKRYPGCILLCEANQWPQDVRAYLGEGDEFHMAFHFPLMPRIFMALKQQDASPIRWAIDTTPSIPPDSQWCTFLRNHDELTLETVTEGERQWMWQQYAREARMRLNLGIRRRLAPLLDNDQQLIELANSLLFTLPGAPVIYYGDEIGMGDNIWLPDRNGVRTPMQWDSTPSAGFSVAKQLFAPVISEAPYDYTTVNVASQMAGQDTLWHAMQRMIKLRKLHEVLAQGDLSWLECGTHKVLAFYRSSRQEQLIAVYNLSPEPQEVFIDLPVTKPLWLDLLTGTVFPPVASQLHLKLSPHQYLWLE